MRSCFCVREFITDSPEFNCPEYTRMNVNWPTYGSAMILKASAEKGSLSLALRVIVFPVSGSRPCVSFVSSGEGR